MFFKLGMFLLAALLTVQSAIFLREYDGAEYAGEGVKMEEETYLYVYDEMTVQVGTNPKLKNLTLYKNGEIIAGNLNEPYTIRVKENDLIQMSADITEQSVIVRVFLKNNLFDEKFYASVFEYNGGDVTLGMLIAKQ